MNDTMPWWQSRTIWGGLVATVAPLVGLADIGAATDVVTNVVAAIGGAVAIYGRMRATKTVTAYESVRTPR